MPHKKPYWTIPLLIGAALYLSTVCRTVFIGDSGEFSLVFKTLGIAHPPGYPLFTLIGRTFTALTAFLQPASSANLLNVAIALAVIPVIFTLFDGRKGPLLAGIITLIWTATPLYWSETVGVEVYTLNLFFIVLITVLAQGNTPRKWILICYIMGLALAHHPLVITVVPPLLLVLYWERKSFNYNIIPYCAAALILGLTIYFYLPLRSSLEPLADWGAPENLTRFIAHITGSQYQHAADFNLANFWGSFKLFAGIFYNNWRWPGMIIILAGLAVNLKYNIKRTLFALLLLVSNLILVSFYAIPDIDSYYLPAMLACLIIAGDFIVWSAEKLQVRWARQGILVTAALLAILLATANYTRINRSDYRLAEDYGKLILDTAGRGTVFTAGDIASFPALYLRYAEDYRPAVEVYDRALRLEALMRAAEELSGKKVSDYQTARNIYLRRAPGAKHLVKSHHAYEEEWLTVPVQIHSNGILYSTPPLPVKSAISRFNLETTAGDFKSRQILINLTLSRGEESLNTMPPDSAGARRDFAQAFDILQDEPRASLHNQLGVFFRHFRFRDLALRAYQGGLEAERLSSKERAEITFNISNIHKDAGNDYIAKGDFRRAAEAYAQALKFDSTNPKLYYNVGVILMQRLNSPEKALPYLETYLRLNPGDKQVKSMLENYRRSHR